MTVTASERLRKFYSVFKNDDHVLVVINADPDAIGSALCVKRLLWRRVSSVSICSISTVKRPDNVAMIQLLGVNLEKTSDMCKSHYTRFVLVDSQPDHNDCYSKFNFNAIIDHHPLVSHGATFMDIRPEYGATSSMMTEYLKAAKIRPTKKLATALILGIKTDTNDFQRIAFSEDIKAFQFLARHINLNLIQQIESSEIDPAFLKYFQHAFETKVMRRGRIYVYLGHVSTPDICVLIADFFLKVKGVNWTIVSGIYGKKLVVILRSDDVRRDAGKMAKKSFETLGSAGGHKTAARAEIPLSALGSDVVLDNTKKVLKWMIEQIEKKTS